MFTLCRPVRNKGHELGPMIWESSIFFKTFVEEIESGTVEKVKG